MDSKSKTVTHVSKQKILPVSGPCAKGGAVVNSVPAMYAIVATGGKQYKVTPGMLLDVEQLGGTVGETVRLQEVLAVRQQERFQIGRPLLKGASVEATIERQLRGPKVISFKYKRRKGYHRKVGHRQLLTRLKIMEITFNGAH